MGNTRYQVLSQQPDQSRGRLLYVSSAVYEGDWHSLIHSHYFTELFYVHSGSGYFIVDNETIPIKKDDLIIVNPNVNHTEKSAGSDPLEYTVLGVDGMSFSPDDNDMKNYFLHNCQSYRDELSFYFNSMLSETEKKKDHYVTVCQDLLEILIIKVMRSSNYAFSAVPTQRVSKECSKIKQHIDTNFSENITLDSLAELTHLNKYYLSHAFSKSFDISPINYLTERRIQCSKELLESTDHSIAEIARISGFSNPSYFSQCFKKVCKGTPVSYRRQSKNK